MCDTSIKLYLDDVCYGYGYVSNGFIILDVVNNIDVNV
jgi:GAG-pre-integrase domain